MKSSHRRSPSNPDVIGILENVYRVEQPTDAWLDGILRGVLRSLDLGGGVGAILYELAADGTVHLNGLAGLGAPDDLRALAVSLHANPVLGQTIHRLHSTWPLCGTFRAFIESNASDAHRTIDRAFCSAGYPDQLVLNSREPSGIGLCLSMFAKERVRLSRQDSSLLGRLATHIATGHRLHRRLSALPPEPAACVEAVLDPRGRIAHAEPPAQPADAQEQLAEAVRVREWARGRARHEETERAVEAWKGLVKNRWTLVDQLESQGKRYILARQNIPAPRGLPDLSERERQVASLAALGRSNKLIAYELDLAHSTVRVLMARAARKLGVSSRSGLIARVQQRDREPGA